MGGCSLRIWLQKDAYIVLGKGGGRGGRKHPIGAGFGNPKSEVFVGCRQAVCICRQMHSGVENLSSVLGCLCVSVDRVEVCVVWFFGLCILLKVFLKITLYGGLGGSAPLLRLGAVVCTIVAFLVK
ncbi:hypothetical protein Taro_022687, partial [Colocasia esculenta]|nr:hypothetical protein [Colocasia esculenta]